MGIITALALVIGLMGGIATAVAVQGAWLYFVIWITFVGWASFYAAGGGQEGLMKSAAANVWGALVSIVSLYVFSKLATEMNAALAAGICVGIAIVVLILGANVAALGFIPGQVFGYAPTAGLVLTSAALYGGSHPKVFLASVVSLLIGNVLGLVSEKAANAVAKS
ncbi:MAG: DUF1097 domain-containing protein [Nocardioides sp.]